MLTRLSPLSALASSAVVSGWLSYLPAFAAPAGITIKFTPPLATAKTIQVTEIISQTKNTYKPGPLHQVVTATVRIKRPNKFRVEWRENSPSHPVTYSVSNGKTLVGYNIKVFLSQPAAHVEWPYEIRTLLSNMPGPVSAMPAVKNGKNVLVAVFPFSSPQGYAEFWFDPKTHLLVRHMIFSEWQGRTGEIMCTEYAGWILNKPLSPAVFRIPDAVLKNRH